MHLPVLPSIISCLTKADFDSAYFVRPPDHNGAELIPCHRFAEECIPATKIMTVSHLRLRERRAIPFHLHLETEKIYIRGEDPGEIVVLLSPPEGPLEKVSLSHRGERLVVPPGYAQALICTATQAPQASCDLLIIASGNTTTDVIWEKDATFLLQNEHHEM